MMTDALTVFGGDTPTKKQFAQVFNRMVVAFNKDADAVTMWVYFDALYDLPAVAVEDGAVALMREPWRTFFPSTGEWRAAAETAAQQRLQQAIQPQRTDWKEDCQTCHDTGWIEGRCEGGGQCGIASCERMARRRGYGAHTYATPCTCRLSNPTYQRHVLAGFTGGRSGGGKRGKHVHSRDHE